MCKVYYLRVVFSLALCLVLNLHEITSQELNCTVSVISPKIQGTTEKQLFNTLQTAIYEFMNNRKWTNDNFTNNERIECSILINVTDKVSTDDFKASIQVQARRPVYNSSYNSVLFNHSDEEFNFRYVAFQPLDFTDASHLSNLTSVLAYYAYIILAFDYDSFSLKGGTPYFQKAQTIVSNAQSASEPGWKAFESQTNRYWLVENLMEQTFAPIRECAYKYYRQGMDNMYTNKETARKAIYESLEILKKVHNQRPYSFSLQVFFNSKADEIVNIFSQALPEEKNKVVTLLKEINPANSNKYDKILASQN